MEEEELLPHTLARTLASPCLLPWLPQEGWAGFSLLGEQWGLGRGLEWQEGMCHRWGVWAVPNTGTVTQSTGHTGCSSILPAVVKPAL